MANKQGQQGRARNKKQEGQGNQGFQEKTKQQQQKGGKQTQQGASQQRGPQPGSQRDKKGRIGL
jgi:hypothetical protein